MATAGSPHSKSPSRMGQEGWSSIFAPSIFVSSRRTPERRDRVEGERLRERRSPSAVAVRPVARARQPRPRRDASRAGRSLARNAHRFVGSGRPRRRQPPRSQSAHASFPEAGGGVRVGGSGRSADRSAWSARCPQVRLPRVHGPACTPRCSRAEVFPGERRTVGRVAAADGALVHWEGPVAGDDLTAFDEVGGHEEGTTRLGANGL
jgi:hypothetical protein